MLELFAGGESQNTILFQSKSLIKQPQYSQVSRWSVSCC